ncbi:MAG: WYL domain-containing protein [Candidatus Wallbacteria bacterium]
MEVKKIRFTIPQFAYDILMSMTKSFKISKNGLLNIILENFRGAPQKTFQRSLNRVIQFNLNVKNNKDYEDFLLKNKIENESEFFRNLIISYASLAPHKREIMVRGDIYEKLSAAIARKVTAIIKFRNEEREVEPYFLANSPEEACNYLFCYSIMHDRFINYKLGNIKDVKITDNNQSRRNEEYIKDVRSNFDSFLSHGKYVKVRLTSDGEKQYYKAKHLRPPVIKKFGGGVYLFECSEAKAKLYFPQFMQNAEILEPLKLRGWFKKMFEEANANYKN